jgi:hypothetical protein
MAPTAGLNDIVPEALEPRAPIVDVSEPVDDLKDKLHLHDESESRDEKNLVPDLDTYEGKDTLSDLDDPDKIIKSGADAAQYMLSDRDDGDPAITVRSMVLGTAFAAFYAAISQIYKVSSRVIWFTRLTISLNLPRRLLVDRSSVSSSGSRVGHGLLFYQGVIGWKRSGGTPKAMKMPLYLVISRSPRSSTTVRLD